MSYTSLQLRAITLAETCRVMILTGGPGTGKTTTICGIIDRMDALGLTVALCAPTGRAAQRMAEATGRHAQTIHRLLCYHPHHGFTRNQDNPLSEDVIIVDEFSMVDVRLAAALTAAIPDGARLIIVGDRDQLPSVGPGRVLHDLIESGTIPTVCLTKIHRQQGGSSIIDNAHRVIHGAMPVTDNMPGQLVVATADMVSARAAESRLGCTVATKFSQEFAANVQWQRIDATGAAVDEPDDVTDDENAQTGGDTSGNQGGGGSETPTGDLEG